MPGVTNTVFSQFSLYSLQFSAHLACTLLISCICHLSGETNYKDTRKLGRLDKFR